MQQTPTPTGHFPNAEPHTPPALAWSCRRNSAHTFGSGTLTSSSADRTSEGLPGTNEPAGPDQPLLQGTDSAAEPADPGPGLLQGPPGTGTAAQDTGTEAGADPGPVAPDTSSGATVAADQGPGAPARGLAGRDQEVLVVPGTGHAGQDQGAPKPVIPTPAAAPSGRGRQCSARLLTPPRSFPAMQR